MSVFDDFEKIPNRRELDPAIEVVVHKLTRMASDMDKLTSAVERMSESMNRLVIVEERIAHVVASIERVHKRLDAVEDQVNEIEKTTILTNKTSRWLEKGVVGTLAIVGAYIAHKVGLM